MIVELGYATRQRVDEVITEARVAARTPEALLLEHDLIDADQLSRAVAERHGLDHIDLNVHKVDMGAANLLSMSAAHASGPAIGTAVASSTAVKMLRSSSARWSVSRM